MGAHPSTIADTFASCSSCGAPTRRRLYTGEPVCGVCRSRAWRRSVEHEMRARRAEWGDRVPLNADGFHIEATTPLGDVPQDREPFDIDAIIAETRGRRRKG